MLRKLFCVGALAVALSATGRSQNGIQYSGGPLITDPHVYFIWYGNWTGNTARSILPDFVNGLNGSRYFDSNTTYSDISGQTILNRLSLTDPGIVDGGSQGTSLTDGSIPLIVQRALELRQLPVDPNGIYFVFTPSLLPGSPATVGKCSDRCGFHNLFPFGQTDIKFAYVGNPQSCPTFCGINNSPNGNNGADAMASWIAHELNETVTDPDGNGWFDGDLSHEVADKCVFRFLANSANFGPTKLDANRQQYNITLGARNFLIQRTWVNFDNGVSQGFCGLGVGVPPPSDVAFVEQQYLDFLDRPAEASGLTGWVTNLNSGTTRQEFIQAVMQSQEIGARGRFIEQAYVGLLTRESDFGGFRFFINEMLNGIAQLTVVQQILDSQEFQNRFGTNLSNDAFVGVLYQNILNRAPDPLAANWTNALNTGALSRAQVALDILQSPEFQQETHSQNRVNAALLYMDMLRRTPDPGGQTGWVSQLDSGVPLSQVIDGFLNSAEYAGRF